MPLEAAALTNDNIAARTGTKVIRAINNDRAILHNSQYPMRSIEKEGRSRLLPNCLDLPSS